MTTSKNKKLGFTLVEMMVAISIFAVVALIVTDAFITADRISKKAQAMKTLVDNLQFALNVMSFNLKQGGTYHCMTAGVNENFTTVAVDLLPIDCPAIGTGGGAQGIAFITPKSSASPQVVAYRLNNNRIQYSDSGSSNFVDITVPNLVVNDLEFYVTNAEEVGGASAGMPRVFITLNGQAKLGKDVSPFQLQTAISERL